MSIYVINNILYIDSSGGNVGIGTIPFIPKCSLDMSTSTDGIIIPSGNTSVRPGNPLNGLLRYNTQLQLLDFYFNAWTELGLDYNVLISATPSVISSSGGQITVTGKNFVSDMSFNLVGRNQAFYDISQNIVDISTAILTTNASITSSNQPYSLFARLSNGQTFTLDPAFTIDSPPTFITASGSLGTFNTATTISTIQIDVSDNGIISSMVINGGLTGSGLSFNYTSGNTFATITGTTSSSSGTYNFTVTVYDNNNLSSSRSFSITLNSTASVNLTFTNPSTNTSLTWDGTNDIVRLGGGYTPITIDIYSDASVYNSAKNRVGLKRNGTTDYMRHGGYTIHLDPFIGNNYDFAWHIVYANGVDATGGYKIFNDFGQPTDYYLGYDSSVPDVRIVPAGDNRVVNWVITPNVTPTYVSNSVVR